MLHTAPHRTYHIITHNIYICMLYYIYLWGQEMCMRVIVIDFAATLATEKWPTTIEPARTHSHSHINT